MYTLQQRTIKPLIFLLALGILNSDLDHHSHENLLRTAAAERFQTNMVDVIATVYLPPTSKAQQAALMDCGNPLLEFVQHNPEPLSEAMLIDRARTLQSRLAPEEIADGPSISKTICRTPDCNGFIDLRTLPLIREINAPDTSQ
jgi:hypothetical protein